MLQVFFSAGALPPVTSIFFIVSVALLDGNPYFNDRVFPVPVKSFIVFFEMDEVCRQGLVLYIGQEISVKFFIGVIDSVHRAGMFCHQVLVGLDFFQNKAIRYNCSFGNGAKVSQPAVLSIKAYLSQVPLWDRYAFFRLALKVLQNCVLICIFFVRYPVSWISCPMTENASSSRISYFILCLFFPQAGLQSRFLKPLNGLYIVSRQPQPGRREGRCLR